MSGREQGGGSVSGPDGVAVRDLARHIRRMALLVRGAVSQAVPQPKARGRGGCGKAGCAGGNCAGAGQEAGAGQCATGPGWWVLAQGGPLDEGNFEAREAAREELLARVRRAGILVDENVWVWDLSGRAQLVLSTVPTLERARKLAQRLRAKGLAIVVRREMGEAATP